MAPKLKLDKSPAANIRRLATRHLDRALESADVVTRKADPGAVHDVRTRTKRLRAIVRLARPQMGKAYKRENAALRDLARELGGARDAEVMVETFDDLLAGASDQTDGRDFAPARARLGRRALEATKELQEMADERGGSVRTGLLAVSARVPGWPIDDLDRDGLMAGVLENYRQGRQARREAGAAPTPEIFHEWRKRAKYGWYQMQILQPVAPDLLRPVADAYHELSSLLGDDHDLVVLSEALRADGSDRGSVDNLQVLIDGRRRELEDRAIDLGDHLYAEKPKQFRRHLTALWKANC
ncbi:MAG: CHAD domain-containing protein [Acidimicrobiia bacterium]